MESKKVFKTISCATIDEFTVTLASITAREDVTGISFSGNIFRPGDVRGSESRFNISWEEQETF